MHRVFGAALRRRPHMRRIAEHLSQWNDRLDNLVTRARRLRIEINLGVTVLALTAGLANIFAFGFRVLADGLAISHLRLADIRLDLVLAHHAVDDDFKMQLAHAADDRLPAIR